MTECYNIRVISSASYSPWSNGVVERHNAIVTEAFWKTRSSGVCNIRPEVYIDGK